MSFSCHNIVRLSQINLRLLGFNFIPPVDKEIHSTLFIIIKFYGLAGSGIKKTCKMLHDLNESATVLVSISYYITHCELTPVKSSRIHNLQDFQIR